MTHTISASGRMCVSEQWGRVLRRYHSFNQIDGAKACPTGLEDQRDEVLSFFQDCYHLKDWIKNSCGNESLNKEVEKFITENLCLTVCGEVCNGIKHLDTSRSRGYEKYGEISLPRPYVIVDTSEENPHVKSVKFSITSDKTGETFDAFDIATECVEKWKDFLIEYRLI
jgi:hypothetical protein